MRYHLSFTSMYHCKQTNKRHRTNILQIAAPLESPATCSDTQQTITAVEPGSWQSIIPLWPVPYYICLRIFHILLSSSSPFPHQQVMAPQTPQPGVIQSELSWTMGASSNAPQAETQQQCRYQLLHCDDAIAATKNMATDGQLKNILKTGCSNNKQQHAIGSEYLHINLDGDNLTI